MGRDASRVGGGGENWGLRALRILTAVGALRRSFSRSRVSLLCGGRTGGVTAYEAGFRVGFTGLGRGGEAPGGRDASEEDREDIKANSLSGSELLLGSEGKTCHWSSSGGGVG